MFALPSPALTALLSLPLPPPFPCRLLMVLSDLIRRVDPVSVHGPVDLDVHRVTRDSREAGVGAAFVAIRGDRVDGHDFVHGIEAGVVFVEREVPVRAGVTRVRVADTRACLAPLAAALNGDPAKRLPVLGVTGTNGKTTVTTLCATALDALQMSAGRIGTLGAFWPGVSRPSPLTTPEAPALHHHLREMLEANVRAAFVEVSSIALVQGRVDALPFHAVAFTNLGHDHLDFHEDMRSYARAKGSLFRESRLRSRGGPPRAVVCADDPVWRELDVPVDRWTYGFSEGCDLRILRTELRGARQRVSVLTSEGEIVIDSALIGRHNASNLTCALGLLATLGLPFDRAAFALGQAPAVRGRLEPVADPAGRIVLVDYAHTPDALRAVLSAAQELSGGRVAVVFGCGGDRDVQKRPVMGQVASELADWLVITSDNPRHEDPQQIIDEVMSGVAGPAEVELDRRRAIARAIALTGPGDVVLIAGKGHELTQQIGDRLYPFDDAAVAAALLLERS
ncbi:MAG: UDP-N-acetylmuramoyl-L-alanyl-D-glutamate--2,6-diaminopimelate ligase [Deltaproteobacteria bacterium]|nr:MAG: UDP-N-acetylmuramoyl-L-alanyl-D-glutamate--2,6-diaminopimelate ligase [Deltaproteobacteria bacterium]